MNVYVRELSSALARAGVECDVFTRAWSPDLPAVVNVEPGLRVHHVAAGPLAPVAKEAAPGSGRRVHRRRVRPHDRPSGEWPERALGYDAIHANYWLSGLAGHQLKHELDLPLVSTFHTLDRVKAESSPEEVSSDEPHRRAEAEAAVMACSEVVLASCSVEADQLVDLYGADPDRIRVVPPGVDHAFFAPGHRPQARRAVGLPNRRPAGRFRRADPASQGRRHRRARARSSRDALTKTSHLVIVGGPSGPHGDEHLAELHRLVESSDLESKVRFVAPQPHELLSTYYRAADVCVVPSRSESFGLVALEAAACGTPVVACRCRWPYDARRGPTHRISGRRSRHRRFREGHREGSRRSGASYLHGGERSRACSELHVGTSGEPSAFDLRGACS